MGPAGPTSLSLIALIALGFASPAAAGDAPGSGDLRTGGAGPGVHGEPAPWGDPFEGGPFLDEATPDWSAAAPGDAADFLKRYRKGGAASAGESATQQPSSGLTWAVQAGLRAVGYDAGPPDGVMGPKTRAAIRQFQRQHDLREDGEIGSELIASLLDALAATRRPLPPLPANAHRIPFVDAWACDSGYARVGDRCDRQAVPAHASPGLLGDTWVCDPGYRRNGNRCDRVVVPLNATATPDIPGDGWACNRGYRQIGQQCDPAPIPRNATRDTYGAGWSCNRGYRQAGNLCIRETLERRATTCCGIPPRP